MSKFHHGDLVRRQTDEVLMRIESLDDSMACCYVVEPFIPSKKMFIPLDDLVLEYRSRLMSSGED
ncbi:hypothetical protein ACB035_17720 [Aeromonas sp. S12(2024)]|uniref:hypothetical protein n=1 Tax=Aeromonas sp. S12(2024) TaxID=3242885 RepID=UPI003528C6F1